jgi:hypothetical protein
MKDRFSNRALGSSSFPIFGGLIVHEVTLPEHVPRQCHVVSSTPDKAFVYDLRASRLSTARHCADPMNVGGWG